jgi:glycosyltransferase involved in cell wall biosynthesis
MNHQIRHICILIPARNEEQLLARCLSSIILAVKLLPSTITIDIILIVDASNDNTFRLGNSLLKDKGSVIEVNRTNVGAARKAGAALALARCHYHPSQCWITNTDADCEVPTTWLLQQVEIAATGYQGIAGIVKVDSFAEHNREVPQRFATSYTINHDHTHPHVHGANIGVRADAYLRVGGWNELETAEDHDLWNRLTLHNIPKISDARIWVTTSGRRTGRAPHGFAGALASHNGE